MRALNSRKVLGDLKRQCRAQDIVCSELPSRGAGSHKGLLFESARLVEAFTLVIPGSKELSPGVQRSILKFTGSLVGKVVIAKDVHDIFQSIFGS